MLSLVSEKQNLNEHIKFCLLYTSDAADDIGQV